MVRKRWLGAVVVASLLLTGCAASAAEPLSGPSQGASHAMPDGTPMSGAEHGTPGADPAAQQQEPSAAAGMVCAGQVVTAVATVLRLDQEVAPTSTWEPPMYSCTYDIDGAPLVLSVHDTDDVAVGEAHFAELQERLGARDIEGMLGLGMPSFSTDAGMVGFLRDGKTLLVDATALPGELAEGTMTRDEVAYAIASAVLVCWVQHD